MACEDLSDQCEVLAAQVAAVTSVLDHNRKAMQAESKRARRCTARARVGATPYVKEVALAAFALTDFVDPAPAARYLARASKKVVFENVEDLQEEIFIIENWFLELDSDKAASLTMPETTREMRVLNAAKKWVAEAATFAWVKETNLMKKVAPRAQRVKDVLLQHSLKHVPALEKEKAEGYDVKQSWCTSKWLQRFRQRWALKIGKLQVRDHVTEPELQKKAPGN